MENTISAPVTESLAFVPVPCLDEIETRPAFRSPAPERREGHSSDAVVEWTDQMLVEACVAGDERAWAMLIGRYKNLIYSFPRRYGAGVADAADVFQMVCAELFRALPRLRSYQSLRAWIMTVASHQAYQWKRRFVQRAQREGEDADALAEVVGVGPVETLERSERERAVREAIAQLPPRCRELVRMLFYADPPVPYERVAGHLGLATGSIGLTRARCLKKLEAILEGSGVVDGCGCE
jgi:RNA polymerase sigma factor (sigma-70 family)